MGGAQRTERHAIPPLRNRTAYWIQLASTEMRNTQLESTNYIQRVTKNGIPLLFVGFAMCFDAVVYKQTVAVHRVLQAERMRYIYCNWRRCQRRGTGENQTDEPSTVCQLCEGGEGFDGFRRWL